jgi:hypothetical protein
MPKSKVEVRKAWGSKYPDGHLIPEVPRAWADGELPAYAVFERQVMKGMRPIAVLPWSDWLKVQRELRELKNRCWEHEKREHLLTSELNRLRRGRR